MRLDRTRLNLWGGNRTLDYQSGNLGFNGGKFQTWVLLINNNGGTFRHAYFADISGVQPARYIDKIQGIDIDSAPGAPNYTYVNTPTVSSGTGFGVAGGGILGSDTGVFIIDTAPQANLFAVQSLVMGIAQLEYYSGNSSRPRIVPGCRADNIGGRVQPRLCLTLFREGTGASWNIDATRLPNGAHVAIRFFGFVE